MTANQVELCRGARSRNGLKARKRKCAVAGASNILTQNTEGVGEMFDLADALCVNQGRGIME